MGYWQISAASTKIVSGFSLETNGYRLGFRASPEGSLPLGQTRGYTSCSLRSRPPNRRMEPTSPPVWLRVTEISIRLRQPLAPL
jgi:hypothetical protein